MADYSDETRLWWQLEGEECAQAVTTTVDSLARHQATRAMRLRRNIEMFEGRRLNGLNPSGYFSEQDLTTDDYEALRFNYARSLVQTAVAKIAGKQKPKAQFCVTDSESWKVRRRAKKMERFVEAHMLQRQGQNHDAWAVWLEAFRDACVCDLGAVKFITNLQEQRVDIRRVLPWEIIIDPHEWRYGEGQNLFHCYGYDRHKLCDAFPDFEEQIMRAPSLHTEIDQGDWYGTGLDITKMVRVREAWRLPISSERPGRWAIVVGNADLTYDKKKKKGNEWTRPFFPIEFIVWEKWIMGMHGTSIVDQIYHVAHEINASGERMSKAERLCSNGMLIYEEGSVREEDIVSNKPGLIIKHRQGSAQPTWVQPSVISQSTLSWQAFLKTAVFELPGVSQMAATSQIEPGITAGVAMRTKENIGSERFAVQWEAYERSVAIGSARQLVAGIHELKEEYPEYAAKWPGQGFLKELRATDAMLEQDVYQVQVYSVSGLVNTPEDRLSLASELFQQQIISQDAYLRIIQAKDIDSELSRTNTWSQLIEKQMDMWLDAEPDDVKNGKFRYDPPIPFMPLADAIVQVGRAYAEATNQGAPDFNRQWFLKFMRDCDALIKQQQAQQSELQAAARGKAQGGEIAPGQLDTGGAPPS